MSGRIMALARLLRERKISCRELIDRYICRIERLNPLLNAYVFTAARQSYKQAERAQKMIDGGFGDILCGIPVAVKDNICTECRAQTGRARRHIARQNQYGRICNGFLFGNILLWRAVKSRKFK